MEGGGEEEHAVGTRWTRLETVILANALKAREEEAHDVASKSAVGTASDKWESISRFCRSHGVTRSSGQCNSRWSKGLYLDYRKVRDWQKNEGVESYWKMKEKKRREHKLPGALDEEVYNVLVSFLDPDLKQTGTPESEVDSDRSLHVVSPALAVEKDAIKTHRSIPSVPAAGATPSHNSGASGDDKIPAVSGHKRKRASTASAALAPSAGIEGRVDIVDTPNKDFIKPIHFNVPPVLDIPRFGEPNVAERSSRPEWEPQAGLASLEARLGAQNEAVWSRVRMLNEQVVQVVDMSNQRLLDQLQSLFTQIRLQLQAQVHEATRAVQAELQTLLRAHSEQIFSQLQLHYSSVGSHLQGRSLPKERPVQNGNWAGERTPRPTPPDIPVDFSQLPMPPLQPVQPVRMARETERNVRPRTGEQGPEGLPASRTNRLLPHISDVQKAETLAASKTRLPPHISDVDRILRQQQGLPTPLPNWNQASFVISELDRVLGHKPLDIHMIPPAPGPTKCTYVVNESGRSLRQRQASDVKLEKANVSPSITGLNSSLQESAGQFEKEMETNSRHVWSEGPVHDVLALPRVSGNPNQSLETSSGQDAEPNSRHPASSDTVDGEEMQDSGQDMGASSEKVSSNHREADFRARPIDNRPRL